MLSRDEVIRRIPSEFKLIYEFHGEIYPLQAKANIPDMGLVKMRFLFAEGELSACLYVTGSLGQFSADVFTTTEIEDLFTMRNALREHINAYLDMSCLYDGWPYQCEITTCLKPSGEKVELNLFSPAVNKENHAYGKRVAKEVLTLHRCFPFLSYALKDFRRAIQDPLETHVLIFRSVESIRHYFAEINNINTDEKNGQQESWRILRESLNYAREDFKFLEDHATARRHGKVIFSSAEDLETCRVFGWKFLIRFIEYTFGENCIVPPKPIN